MLPSADDSAYVGTGASAGAEPLAFSVLGDKLLYRGVTSSVNGSIKRTEYLSLDSTSKNLTTVSVAGVSSFEDIQVGVFNGFSYFYVNSFNPVISTTLYKSDGINIAVAVKTFLQYDDLHDFTEVNDELFFVLGTNELWKTDGTFFTTDDGVNGTELWVTDGTVGGTNMIKNIRTGQGSTPALFREGNGFLIFSAVDDDGRAKLWKTDGTEAGTSIVKDINSGGFDNAAFFQLAGQLQSFKQCCNTIFTGEIYILFQSIRFF